MRIGILGYYGFHNLGDELNLQCMMKNLEEQFDSVEFFTGQGNFFPPGTSTKDALNSCDLLIVGGGGLIYLGDFWFPFMDENITTPYVIYRVGIDDSKVTPNVVRKHKEMFLRASEVTVRDHYSLQLCRKYLTDNAEVVPEPIWNHPYQKLNQNNDKEKKIGINLRGFHPEVYPILRTFLEQLKKQGYQMHFIPCQVTDRGSELNDNQFHKLIAGPDDFILPDDSTYEERCVLISEMEFCIGMRLHFVLLSLSQRVPVIALNYNNKVKGLMDEVGLSEYLVPLDLQNLSNHLNDAFRKLEHEKEAIISYLEKRIPDFEEGAKRGVNINGTASLDTI